MWPSELSPEEFLYRLRWLELNQPFRYTAQYSNVMYTAAGYIAAAAAGKPWETLVREKILEPAGMEQSCFSAEMMHRADDYAQGHLWTGKGWKQMPAWEMKGAEACGFLVCRAERYGKMASDIPRTRDIPGQANPFREGDSEDVDSAYAEHIFSVGFS